MYTNYCFNEKNQLIQKNMSIEEYEKKANYLKIGLFGTSNFFLFIFNSFFFGLILFLSQKKLLWIGVYFTILLLTIGGELTTYFLWLSGNHYLYTIGGILMILLAIQALVFFFAFIVSIFQINH